MSLPPPWASANVADPRTPTTTTAAATHRVLRMCLLLPSGFWPTLRRVARFGFPEIARLYTGRRAHAVPRRALPRPRREHRRRSRGLAGRHARRLRRPGGARRGDRCAARALALRAGRGGRRGGRRAARRRRRRPARPRRPRPRRHAQRDGGAGHAGRARRDRPRLYPRRRLPRGDRTARARPARAPPGRPAVRRASLIGVSRKLVLIIIDGLTPQVFEDAVTRGTAPALAFLAEHGDYRRGVSTFPSLTPVSLASIATGAHPSQHGIPGLVWYDREHGRIVEYGSSFAAIRAVGSRRAIRDAIITMNRDHLSRATPTIFEMLERAGLTTAAVNFTVYRGPVVHRSTLGSLVPAVEGPSRFLYSRLFESDRTVAPLAIRDRSLGAIDAYAASVGRWLVTRDGFDCLVYYLPDYDFASHARGPGATQEALTRSDAAVGALLEAAGGGDAFLERYEVILCSDHGQTAVREGVQLERAFADVPLLSSRGPASEDRKSVV